MPKATMAARELSRVEFMCEDARLGRVLRSITAIGGVYHLKAVPVVNRGHRSTLEDFAAFAKGRDVMHPSDVRTFCASVGMQPGSYTYILKLALRKGILAKTGKGKTATYKVRG